MKASGGSMWLFSFFLLYYIPLGFGSASSFSPLLPFPLPSPPISYTLSADPCASFYLITLMAVWYPLSPFPPSLAISPFLRDHWYHWLLCVQPSSDPSLETDESICLSQSNKKNDDTIQSYVVHKFALMLRLSLSGLNFSNNIFQMLSALISARYNYIYLNFNKWMNRIEGLPVHYDIYSGANWWAGWWCGG